MDDQKGQPERRWVSWAAFGLAACIFVPLLAWYATESCGGMMRPDPPKFSPAARDPMTHMVFQEFQCVDGQWTAVFTAEPDYSHATF